MRVLVHVMLTHLNNGLTKNLVIMVAMVLRYTLMNVTLLVLEHTLVI